MSFLKGTATQSETEKNICRVFLKISHPTITNKVQKDMMKTIFCAGLIYLKFDWGDVFESLFNDPFNVGLQYIPPYVWDAYWWISPWQPEMMPTSLYIYGFWSFVYWKVLLLKVNWVQTRYELSMPVFIAFPSLRYLVVTGVLLSLEFTGLLTCVSFRALNNQYSLSHRQCTNPITQSLISITVALSTPASISLAHTDHYPRSIINQDHHGILNFWKI